MDEDTQKREGSGTETQRPGGPRRFEEENRGERTSRLDNSQGQRAATQTGSSGTIDQGGKFAQAGAGETEGKPPRRSLESGREDLSERRTRHAAEGPTED